MTYLNSEQQAIVTSIAPQILVAAGAGSGKSTTLVARIAARVSAGVDPQRIWLISFTNAAAKVFTEKLAPLGIRLGYAGTLHGAMLRLLNKHGSLIGYRRGRNLTILDEPARLQMLRETAERLGHGKLSMRALEEGTGPKERQVQLEYAFEVKRANMIDYTGILAEGLKLLVMHRADLDLNLAEVCVDEAQDGSALDWMIYDRLAAKTLTVIGDDAQSIFGFRGARPELFLERATTATLYSLETNYRSATSICAAANRLISHNANRIHKVIRPSTEAQGSVTTLEIESSREEPAEIGRLIRGKVGPSTPYSEIAVLARTNAIADDLRNAFRDMGIPTADDRPALPSGWPFCLLVFQLMIDPSNNLLCERFLKERHIPAAIVNRLKMSAMMSGHSLAVMVVKDGICAVPVLRDDQPLLPALAQHGVEPDCLALVAERLDQLPEDGSNTDLLADLFGSENWLARPSPGVFVGTVHSAKGREWEMVVVAGLEEGVLPSLAKSEDLEEARRLAFVAMTRAKHTLILSWCWRRTAYGRTTTQTVSRFVKEALR